MVDAAAAPSGRDLDDALAAFANNDVPVLSAIAHVIADVPRAELLELRLRASLDAALEARELVAPFASAIMLEAFVARPLDTTGEAAEALKARLAALPVTPRYDPWLVTTVLTGTARNLATLGRHAESERVAREAVRYIPTDPYALAAVADACAAQGNFEGAASVRAYLRDAGYGAPIVTAKVPPEERTATAYRPDLRGVAPLSDEDLARFIALVRFDNGFGDSSIQPLRHAANLVRRGDFGGARIGPERCKDWEVYMSSALAWLGFRMTPIEMVGVEALGAAIDDTAEGQRAIEDARKTKQGSRHNAHSGYRRLAIETFAAAGRLDEIAPLLADWTQSIRFLAIQHLPDHPITRRLVELDGELAGHLPGTSASLVTPWENEYTDLHGGNIAYERGGARIAYPSHVHHGHASPKPPIEFPPTIDRAEAARATCRACKQKIEKGDLRLSIPISHHKRDEKHLHARCGLEKRYRPDLAAALDRDRRDYPERADLELALSAPPAKAKKKPLDQLTN